MDIVVFQVENRLLGLELPFVDRVIFAVEITPLPHAAPPSMGVINISGEIVPVVNLRTILDLPAKEVQINDQFLVCKTRQQRIALFVDSVLKVLSCEDSDKIPPQKMSLNDKEFSYAFKHDGEVIFVITLEKFLPNLFAYDVASK